MAIEIYDQCALCDKWDDLVRWREIVLLCHDCQNYMIEHAPRIQGGYKCNNEDTFIVIKADYLLKREKDTKDG